MNFNSAWEQFGNNLNFPWAIIIIIICRRTKNTKFNHGCWLGGFLHLHCVLVSGVTMSVSTRPISVISSSSPSCCAPWLIVVSSILLKVSRQLSSSLSSSCRACVRGLVAGHGGGDLSKAGGKNGRQTSRVRRVTSRGRVP